MGGGNKQDKTMVMSLYFSHILKSVNHEWFIYFYRTDFECFQILFDIKKQTVLITKCQSFIPNDIKVFP
jgi:hypothetical protein